MRPQPRVTLVLNSYDDLRDDAAPVVEWLDTVRSELTDNLAQEVGPGSAGYEPRVLARLRDSDRLTRKKYTPVNWDRTRSQLLAGALDTVWIEYFSGTMEFETEADLDPSGPRFALFIERRVIGDEVSMEVQAALVRCLQAGARLLRAATGFLTIDVFPCPYEAIMGCEQANRRRYDEQVRGYYWGNILSAGHIARLGGSTAIHREAPCVAVEDVGTSDHELIYLQSTRNLDQWSDEAVRSMGSYLAPLLPGGVPDPEYSPLALHVVEQGPRPERPAAPGTRYWEWLEGVRARTGTTPPALDLEGLQAEADVLSPGPRVAIPQEALPELFLDSMEITLVLEAMPTPDVRLDLIRLVDVWAAQGIEGAFGDGVMHSVDRPSFHETDSGNLVFGFLADLGSAGKTALDVLIERLERFVGGRGAAVERIVLGHGGLDT